MLTRLRQIVLHPGLIPANYLDQLRVTEDTDSACGNHSDQLKATDSTRVNIIQMTPELKAKLEALILRAIEDNEECPICFDVVTEPRITPCTHVFCLAWYVLVRVSPFWFGSRWI